MNKDVNQKELPKLEMDEYFIIKKLRDQAPERTSFSHLQKKITESIPRLKAFKIDLISKAFFRIEDTNWPLPECLFSRFANAYIQLQLREMILKPNRFLISNNYPLFISRQRANWVEEEDELLISIMNDAKEAPNFAMISLCFPGRNGGQVYQRFRALLQKNKIRDPRGLNVEKHPNDPMLHRYFLKDAEKSLTDELLSQASKGIQVSLSMIQEKAEEWYKHSWILAERACYQMFSKNGEIIYVNEKESIYTDDFMEKSREIEMDINENMYDEDGEIDEHEYENFLQHFNLHRPNFSYIWVKSFMKRNRISWRTAHYARRGSIDPEYVDYFLDKLAKAFITYGENAVFNMDETSIRINNSSTKTIGRIGLEEITINAKRNSKECFTTIATCTIKEKKPLIILTKGLTAASTMKFKASKDTMVWETGNQQGWINSDIMEDYLDVLHSWAGTFPCALLLDCYSAHRTKEIKKLAKAKKIELIFVPANGTGLYQPLDRRIFGILKSKLRSYAKSRIYSGDDRFATVTNQLVKAWDEIKIDNLESAWNIPGLVEYYNRIKSKDTQNQTIQNMHPEAPENFDEDDWDIIDEFFDDDDDETSDSSDPDYK